MPRSYGHKCGMERMIGLMEHAFEIGVDHVTVYALSTENLKRPKEELDHLFELFRTRFNEYLGRAYDSEVRFRAIGELALLPEDIQKILRSAEERTAKFTKKNLCVAAGYGGRREIVAAVNKAVERYEKVTEKTFQKLLYTDGIPDPDLIIRTGKEMRLSNFLLYQAAYAELYFSKKMFPDFTNRDLEKAIGEYARRTRRFGKTDDQLKMKT